MKSGLLFWIKKYHLDTLMLGVLAVLAVGVILYVPPSSPVFSTDDPVQIEPVYKSYGAASWNEIWEEGYDYSGYITWLTNSEDIRTLSDKTHEFVGDKFLGVSYSLQGNETGILRITMFEEDPFTEGEMDFIYELWKSSAEKAGIYHLPLRFESGSKMVVTIGEVKRVPDLDLVVLIKSVSLILCVAGVCAVAFSRTLKLPENPESRSMKILSFIEDHPGASEREIISATDFSRGSVLYHLKRLTAMKKIRRETYHGVIRYSTCFADQNELEKILRTILSKEKSARVLLAIRDNPRITNAELAELLGITSATANWHGKRFLADGVVVQKNHSYEITIDAENILQEYFSRSDKS